MDWVLSIFTGAVPNLLNWLAVIVTIGGFILACMIFVWKKYLSDKWARRSEKAAHAKAIKVIEDFDRIRLLRNDDNYFRVSKLTLIPTWATAVGSIVMGFIVMTANGVDIESPSVDDAEVKVSILSSLLFGGGYFLAYRAITLHISIQKALVDWDNYLVVTSIRVKALLDKANMNNQEQKEFIYSIPNMAVGKEREILKHKEGGHPELHTAVVEMALLDRNPHD